jgi:hypothetical protein
MEYTTGISLGEKNMITLVSMFRNEGKYLREWLCYYHLIGIEHFIVFLHKNTDDSLDIINSLSFKNKIETIKIEEENNIGVSFQNNVLKKALELSKTEWVIYLDIDEFLYLNDTNDINKFLVNYQDVGGIAIYQNIFGSSGNIKSPSGLVIDNYLYRNNNNLILDKKTLFMFSDPVNLFSEVKFILNKNTVSHIKTIHEIFCSKKIVIEDGSIFKKQKIKRLTNNICINHYFTKSKEDWEFKTGRQRISGSNKYSNDFFEYFSSQNYLDNNIKNKYSEKIKLLK